MAEDKKEKKSRAELKLGSTPISQINQADFIATIRKQLAKDHERIVGSKSRDQVFIRSGCAAVDFITSGHVDGTGGWPMGRIVEIYGNESTGKSLLGYLALIQCLRQGGVGVLIDTEHSFQESFFRMLGGNPDDLIIEEPPHINDVYDYIYDTIIRVKGASGDVPLVIVYDSLAGSPTVQEYEAGMGTVDYGKRAQAHYQGCRLITDVVHRSNTLLFVVNQLRHTMAMFGPDQDTVGGLAMKHFASLRCHLKRGKRLYDVEGEVKEGGGKGSKLPASARLVGVRGRFVVEKTRFTPPFREVNFDIMFYGGGLSPFSGWMEALKSFWLDDEGLNRIVGAPSADGTKVRPGYYLLKGDDPSKEGVVFSKATFVDWLSGAHPELLAGYDPAAAEIVPDGDSLASVECDPASGEEIAGGRATDDEEDGDPTDAAGV